MIRFNAPYICVLLGLIAPIGANAASFCVAVDGGFGNGGTSFIAPKFTVPAPNHCAPWAGFTKTGSSVVAIANGTGCLSTGGTVITLSIFDVEPSFFGIGASASDQITLCASGVTGCPVSGQDVGYFSGTAAQQTCSASLLKLPDTHD